VTLTREGAVAVIEIDNPPVNAASQPVRAGLLACLQQALADDAVRAIVLACAGATFTAGADIREIGQPPVAPILPDVCAAIEASDKPVVAALHGTALGGGCEMALGCHARIASADAKLGLPEVKLGLIPGAGGTQRLPRLIGVIQAMRLIASGQPMAAPEALSAGLIDLIAEQDVRAEAIVLARRLAGARPRRTSALAVAQVDADAANAEVASIRDRARGQIAPGVAAEVTLESARMSFAEGLAVERAAFLALAASEQSAALRHIFFAERAAAKPAALAGAGPRPLAHIGVVGAGLMGAGIAAAALSAGLKVTIVETNPTALVKGRDRVGAIVDKAIASGRAPATARDAADFALGVGALAGCDLVIEAVFDDLQVKQDLFRALDATIRPDAILATNTSYLNPEAIAEVVGDRARVLALHFFSPAHIMRLVEVVPIHATAPDVLATGFAFARRLGKLPVLAGNGEGFIGNRIFSAYRTACDVLIEDGALPHEIDAAMEAFGLPMGPFAVFDMAGLDIAWARRKRQAATRDPAERYVPLADRLCEMGRFGQKTGAGWYRYPDGKRQIDPEVSALIVDHRRAKGITPRVFSDTEIVQALIGAMAAEGRNVLAQGIAQRAADIDLVFVNGYGWPGWRGGPMFQAERLRL
jgi:3-hydroxyacyl-CoA dehydrogenase